jgi:hypothetical protein
MWALSFVLLHCLQKKEVSQATVCSYGCNKLEEILVGRLHVVSHNTHSTTVSSHFSFDYLLEIPGIISYMKEKIIMSKIDRYLSIQLQ